jgi:cellobiose-specific phosphotransferase system component IIA
MFLGVYGHPADGYDYLFIIINEIIERYNSFILRLNTYKREYDASDITESSVSPKAILPGSLGEVFLVSLKWIDSIEFSRLVERFRYPQLDEYNVKQLEMEVHKELSSCEFMIESPMNHLRQRFQFRHDFVSKLFEEEKIGYQSSGGFYFVHLQDLQLFEDCYKQVKCLVECYKPDIVIKDLLRAKFNGLDYEQLRTILIGFRSTFQRIAGMNSCGLKSLEEFMSSIGYSSTSCPESLLKELGLPSLSGAQLKIVLSLTSSQLFDMVHYVGFQLASEGHLYSNLPLSMNTPISPGILDVLKSNITELSLTTSCKETINALQEFKDDILSFYQNQIRDHCSGSSGSMKDYLKKHNFCDESDLIFDTLPSEITVRNYIQLQQELHQLRLHFANSSDDPSIDSKNDNDLNYSLLELRHGKSWFWSSRDGHKTKHRDNEEDIDDSSSHSSDVDDSFVSNNSSLSNLWFEVGRYNNNKNNDDDISYGIDTDDDFLCNSFHENNSSDDDSSNTKDFVYNGEENTGEENYEGLDNEEGKNDEVESIECDSNILPAVIKLQKWFRTKLAQKKSEKIAARNSNVDVSECPSIEEEGHTKNSTMADSISISDHPRSSIKPGDVDQEEVHIEHRAVGNSVPISVHSRSSLMKASDMFDMLERLVNLSVKIAFCIYVYKYINSDASH